MALIHPRSLERWQEWRSSRRRARGIHRAVPAPLRRVAGGTEPGSPPGYLLHTREGDGSERVLLGVDTSSDTTRGGLLVALSYLHGTALVLTPAGLDLPELSGPDWEHEHLEDPRATLDQLGISSALTLGWHLDVGRLIHEWTLASDVPSAVVQHDVLSPFAPPLPPRTTFLAWSEADGDFQRAGRDDVEVRVVGSQRLWQAAHANSEGPEVLEDRPVFLGQLASIELPRRLTLGAAHAYCRSLDALYQPGPEETDRLSRAAHALLRRRGVELQLPPLPVARLERPVVAVYSADVLEAAVRGLPAWVHGPRMPSWVHEQWERYGMRRSGGEPTPAPPQDADEPARLIAQILEGTA
ncbi:hypothetical protein [Brachybacterium sacelli]|uniref:Uncharacterized protein n=2 Tax=Brachybacterium sacelli TaxID=173364 RepID=A0ABS4WY01_9MICO|nr:hypothetical protein [Brachybacterium sacelli]MBP2381073.1 hypothetical protein [Brachybacterium sacelli]